MLDDLQGWFSDVETVLLTLLVVIAVWVIIKALASGNRSWTRALILIPIAVLVVWGASNIESLTGPIQEEFDNVFGTATPASALGSSPVTAADPTDATGMTPDVVSVMGGGSSWLR